MPLPSFHNVIFPEDISFGSSGGPGFNTTVIELASGAEQRNVNWSKQRAMYDVSHGVKVREQMEHLLDFFTARRGKAYAFRFKDWMDFKLERQVIGYATEAGAVSLPVFKRYEPETIYSFDRPLIKLVPETIALWADGSPLSADFCDPNTGLVAVPGGAQSVPASALIEIACEFHVPVRFDTDEMQISHDDWEQMSWPSIPLVEVKNV